VLDSPESDKDVRVVEQSVTAGRLIHKVQPKYPKAARKAHVEGTVVLCAEIRKDGKVANLRALSGPKELIDPSIKAVQQWISRPYLIDGEPVDVETDIRVNFRLD
jgi:bla regulator protein blaR1